MWESLKVSQNSEENTGAKFFLLKQKFLKTPIFIEQLWWLPLKKEVKKKTRFSQLEK